MPVEGEEEGDGGSHLGKSLEDPGDGETDE